MCNRVQLLAYDTITVIDVVIDGSIAIIHVPDSIDATALRKKLEGSIDHEQIECATKLWADDSYQRFFDVTARRISISCFRQD